MSENLHTMYEAERAREASEAYPMGGEGGVTYEEYTSEEMSYVGGGSVEGYETVDVAAPMGGEYYGEQPYYEEPAVYAPTGVGVSVLGVGVGGGVGYVGAYGKAPDAARAQAQAPAPAQAPAQAPAKAPAPQQVVPVVQVKPSAARAAAAAATTPAAGAATTTPASGHRHAGDANFIEYCVRLNLPFEGRQGDLADPAVRVRRIDAHTILEACKTAQQKLLPDQRTISNPETLDLGHVFVGDVTLEVLHNTFTRSFTVTCTSHAGLNNSVGPGGRKTCFFVGEDGHVSYPDLCLVDRRHLLKDGLFIQVAGETADRVLREPFIKMDTRKHADGRDRVLLLSGSPLHSTLLDVRNQETLMKQFPHFKPSEAPAVKDAANVEYSVMHADVAAAAAVMYATSHKNLVDLVDFGRQGLVFELDTISGGGSLLSKGGMSIDPDVHGHVWAELEVTLFFPKSSVANVLRSSRAKKETKVSAAQNFWSKVSVGMKEAMGSSAASGTPAAASATPASANLSGAIASSLGAANSSLLNGTASVTTAVKS